MYKDKSAHREHLIREVVKIKEILQNFCKEWWRTKHATPESATAEAYELALMAIDNLILHYDPEFRIQDLIQQELVSRVEAHFKKGSN